MERLDQVIEKLKEDNPCPDKGFWGEVIGYLEELQAIKEASK